MKKISPALVAILVALVSIQSNAGILVEPYGGYFDGGYKTPSGTKYDMSGVGFGSRLGYVATSFVLGADYLTGSWKDTATPNKNTAIPADLGAFVGLNGQTFRLYYVHTFNSVLRLENSSSRDKLEGESWRAILGIRAFSMMNINVEYMQGTYDKRNGDAITAGDYKTKMYGLTLSIPIQL